MKTIKVTIPGKPSALKVFGSGPECKIIKTGLEIFLVSNPGSIAADTLIEYNTGHRLYCLFSDLEEIPCTLAITREFKVPKSANGGHHCNVLHKIMDCRGAWSECPDCIYHYLATL